MPALASVVGPKGIAPKRVLTGVVVSAGKMDKCVKVRVAKQVWNKRVHKFYAAPYNILVSDPSSSTRLGDVVSVQNGWRTSKLVRHVVNSIIAPMGPPLSERPPIPTEAERLAKEEAKRAAKDARQAARGRVAAAQRVNKRNKMLHEVRSWRAKVRWAERQVEKTNRELSMLTKELPDGWNSKSIDEAETGEHTDEFTTASTPGASAESEQIPSTTAPSESNAQRATSPDAHIDTASPESAAESPLQAAHQQSTPTTPSQPPESSPTPTANQPSDSAAERLADTAANAQQREASALEAGEKELPASSPPAQREQPAGDTTQSALRNVRKAQQFEEKALDNERDIERLEDRSTQEDKAESGPEGKESGGADGKKGLLGWLWR